MEKVNYKIVRNWMQEIISNFSKTLEFCAEGDIIVNEIDCSKLDEKFITQDIRDSAEFKELFKSLEAVEEKPCVYFFEIVSETTVESIIDNLKNFKGEGTVPAIKSNYPKESNILYVGKVKKLIWGRLIAHMGFHTTKNNPGYQSKAHGLQLRHWAKNIKLRFYVYVFNPVVSDYMEIIERKFAKELNPIIGKH